MDLILFTMIENVVVLVLANKNVRVNLNCKRFINQYCVLYCNFFFFISFIRIVCISTTRNTITITFSWHYCWFQIKHAQKSRKPMQNSHWNFSPLRMRLDEKYEINTPLKVRKRMGESCFFFISNRFWWEKALK